MFFHFPVKGQSVVCVFVCVSNRAILSIKHAEGIGGLAPASGHTRHAMCVSVGSKK